MTLRDVPPIPAKVRDAPKRIVVLKSDVVHVAPQSPRANVRPIEAIVQSQPDAQAVVCQGVAEETRPEMLHCLRKGSGVRGDDGGAAELGFDVQPTEGLEVDAGGQEAGELT